MEKNLVIGIQEKPSSIWKWIILSLQHVFAMFGATVLVPVLTGLPVGVALVASGIGTLIYIGFTRGKVPVYLGSSFAYIGAIIVTSTQYGFDAVMTGLVIVGLIYVTFALIIKYTSKEWIKVLLPARVIGPLIMIIGLTLLPVAMEYVNLVGGFLDGDYATTTVFNSWSNNIALLIGLVTLASVVIINKFGEGFVKVIPIILGIAIGVLAAQMSGLYSISSVEFGSFFVFPDFKFFWNLGFDFQGAIIFAPLALVTIAEHIGDHTVLGQICEEDFLLEPGLDNTLLGDGVATAVSGLIGGPANTTYGENTGVVALTKVGSVYVTGTAAIFAFLLGFIGVIADFLNSIPLAVMGGISLILFSLISYNGYKVLKSKVIWNWQAGVVVFVTLFVGLSPIIANFLPWFPVISIPLNDVVAVEGMALAALAGIAVSYGLSFLESDAHKELV